MLRLIAYLTLATFAGALIFADPGPGIGGPVGYKAPNPACSCRIPFGRTYDIYEGTPDNPTYTGDWVRFDDAGNWEASNGCTGTLQGSYAVGARVPCGTVLRYDSNEPGCCGGELRCKGGIWRWYDFSPCNGVGYLVYDFGE